MVGHQLTPAASSSAASESHATSSSDRQYRYWVGVGSAVICGICFGIAPGIVSVYLPFYDRMKDCAAHTAQSTCLSAPNAHCEWVEGTCRFSDWRVVDCPAYNGDPTGCAAVTQSSSSHDAAQTPLTPAPFVTTTSTSTSTLHVHSPPPPAAASSYRPTTHAAARFNWIGDGALRRNAHAAAAAAGSSSLAADGGGVCSYDYEAQTCAHVAGYDDTRTGVYAASSTALGAMVPLAIDAVRKRYGLPTAFATCAAIALLSNVLASWSLLTDAFAVMVAARLIYGGIAYAVMGLCMSFVEASAPAATPAAGMALNFAVNLTYLLLDAYGVYAPRFSSNYFWLLEGLHGFQWIITIAVVLFIPVAANVLKQPVLLPSSSSSSPVLPACVRSTDELSTINSGSFGGCEKDATSSHCDMLSPFKDALPLYLASTSELATSVATTATGASGTSTADTLSPAGTPPPQELMMPAAPCLVVSPALGSPPRERHVSFAAAAPQVVMLTAASSAAPSPSHHVSSTSTSTDASSLDAAPSQVGEAGVRESVAGVSDTNACSSRAAALTGTSDQPQRDSSCDGHDHVQAVGPLPFNVVTQVSEAQRDAPKVEEATSSSTAPAAEAETSFVEDLRALVTLYRTPLLRGILIASLENGCGIAAVTNFAPILLESSGFDPMQGNLVCGLAYVLGAALGPAAERRFSVRSRAFGSAFAMSAAALLIGLSMLPPIDLGLLTVVGLVAWIGALSAVYAPIYYYASVKLFPATCQATGSAVMLMTSAFWTLVESAVFPSVVTILSGGEDGDKRWGRGLTFMTFAALGTALSLLLVKTFKTWDEVEAEARLENDTTMKQTAKA